MTIRSILTSYTGSGGGAAALVFTSAGRIALDDTVLFDGKGGVHVPAARRRTES